MSKRRPRNSRKLCNSQHTADMEPVRPDRRSREVRVGNPDRAQALQ